MTTAGTPSRRPAADPTGTTRGVVAARHATASLVLAAGLLASPVQAQTGGPRYDAAWHGGVAAAGLTSAVLFQWLDRHDARPCSWCGIDANGQPDLPRLDAWARRHWRNAAMAARVSNVSAGAAYALPVVALVAVHGGVDGEWARDLSVVASSLAVTQLATDVTKRWVRRARPYVVFGQRTVASTRDVQGFFSGHTATAFATVTSVAAIAARRDSGHRAWITAGGLALATTTGYLRIAGDEHFLSDVLVGAAVGSGAALLMTRLFDDRSSGAPVPSAAAVVGVGPAALFGPAGSVRLQVGVGARRIGVVGAVGR